MKNLRILLEEYRNSSMSSKLIISFSTLIIIATLVPMTIIYGYISSDYKKQILYSADQSFSQAHGVIEKKIANMVYISEMIYFDSSVQIILNKPAASTDYLGQYQNMLELEKILQLATNSKDIYLASLYVKGDRTYSDQNLYFFNEKKLELIPQYVKWRETNNETFCWLPPEYEKIATLNEPVRLFTMLRKIHSYKGDNSVIGIESISVKADDIDNIVNKANITQSGAVFIQNAENEIISSLNSEKTEYIDSLELKGMNLNENNTWKSMESNGQEFLLHASAIYNTDWLMVAIIPNNEFLSVSNHIRNIVMILLFVMIVISCSVAILIAHSLTKRLGILARQMEDVKNGNLNTTINSSVNDEVGNLINDFHYMTEQIKQLVTEQYENGKAIKNAELKALQAQINPHFLYNTLDLINWMALDSNTPRISEVSLALAKFYKLSLSKGKDIVPIEIELAHVSIYVRIQNYRFEDSLNLYINVPYEIQKCGICKNILQPIVENSILHGLLPCKDDRSKQITISGEICDQTIILSIQDNGVGMSEEKKDSLMQEDSLGGRGYGVWNIYKRIKLCYGEEYELSYESTPDYGTTAFIRIPAISCNEYSYDK